MALGKFARTLRGLGRAASAGGHGRRAGASTKGRLRARISRFEPLEDRHLLSVGGSWLPQHYFQVGRDGALTGPSSGAPVEIALDYLSAHAAEFGLEPADVASAVVTDAYSDAASGITHVYLRQTYMGLPVVNTGLNVNLSADGRVLSAGGEIVGGLSAQSGGVDAAASAAAKAGGAVRLSAAQAVNIAAAELGFTADTQPTQVLASYPQELAQPVLLQDGDLSLDPIPAELLYVAGDDGMRLAWQTVMRAPSGDHWYDASLDASTGALLRHVDWVHQASYNVFAIPTKDPTDGSQTLVVDPAMPSASPYGWHDIDGVAGAEYTNTRGNNVFAQDDIDGNNSGGSRPTGGSELIFNFPFNSGQAPSNYRSAATTNLFYWTNICHDVFFQYGFDEAAGNFQQTNYSGVGLGGDAVLADSQNGYSQGWRNDHRILVPPDGQSPRMELFVYNTTSPERDSDLESQAIVHEYGHGVSERLVGGRMNVNALVALQSAAMGEGWSDYFSLVFTQKPENTIHEAYPVGAYTSALPGGVRRHPYAFDLTINPASYGDYNVSQEAHDAGEIWASALWDLNWLLIQRYGFSPADAEGNPGIMFGYDAARPYGNTLGMRLVLDSMKLMPVNPTLLDGRDAMLQADWNLTGGMNQKEIWEAFARRGMGIGAADGGSPNAVQVVDDTNVPASYPRASLVSPTLPASALSRVRLVFSEAMDPTSFSTAEDVQAFLGPGGVDLRGQIVGDGTWLDPYTLEISFRQQDAGGQYVMILGPQILDLDGGNPMDQDDNGVPGEVGDAVFFSLDVVADSFGYRITTLPYEAIDLAVGDPDVVALTLADLDEGYAMIPLGANRFRFYGQDYTSNNQLYVYANGFITLGATQTGDTTVNGDLTDFPTRATIAPHWDNLDLTGSTDGILYKFEGNRLIIEWSEAAIKGYSPEDTVTFQAILELNTGESSGSIIFNYPDLMAGVGSEASRATAGIKWSGTQGGRRLIVAQDQPWSPYVADRAAVRIIHAATISGQVLGTIPGETEAGLANWTVYLDENNDGVLGETETWAVTDEEGRYTFSRLPSGTYTVREIVSPGWTRTAPTGAGAYTSGVRGGQEASGFLSTVTSITRVGSTATVLLPGHQLSTGASVTIAGAGQSQYNGTFTVTVIDANTFTYTVSGSPATPATGTITAAHLVFRNRYNNQAPEAEDPQAFEIDENLPAGAPVGTITVSDPDIEAAINAGRAPDQALQYYFYLGDDLEGLPILSDVDPFGAFRIDVATGQLTVADPRLINFEVYLPPAPHLTLSVRVLDSVVPPLSVDLQAEITLRDLNDSPTVLDFDHAMEDNETLNVEAPGLLTGAGDEDHDTFVAALARHAVAGVVTVNADGSFQYVPPRDFVGVDTFTYVARDARGAVSREATVTITVGDPDRPPITVLLTPAPGLNMLWEGQGAGAGTGLVRIASPLLTDLRVMLGSSDTTEVSVQESVMIWAGQTEAAFSVATVDDLTRDGNQTVTLLAWAPGFLTGVAQVEVGDDEVVAYAVKNVASPQVARVPFLVDLEVQNVDGDAIETFFGSAAITATSHGSPLPGVTATLYVPPGELPPEDAFEHGKATFQVMVPDTVTEVRLQVSDGFEVRGQSNAFDVTHGSVARFEFAPLTSAPSAGLATNVEVRALDPYGFGVENYNGTPLVTAWALQPETPKPKIVISECGDTTPDFIEIQNVSGTAVDTSGWRVLLNDPTHGDPNAVFMNSFWLLPDTMAAGSFDYRSDDVGDAAHYLGGNLDWGAASAKGWAMIVDDALAIHDFVAWGYTSFEIQNLHVSVGDRVLGVGAHWAGAGVPFSGGSGLSLQRMSNRESNTAMDFAWLPTSLNRQNPSLVLPFQDTVTPVSMGRPVLQVVRSNSTVTVTMDEGHGFDQGAQVWIQGADQPEYNGLFKIFVVDPFTFSYVIARTPASPATGRITAAPATLNGFLTGVWKGGVTIPDASSAIFLQVNDQAGHLGESQMFSVLPFTPAAQVSGPGLYDPLTSLFQLRNSNSSGFADQAFGFGPPGADWIPIAGDWDGDGTTTIGLYDPKTSLFQLRNSNSTGFADLYVAFGAPGAGWIPIAGDWNGDDTDTVGLYDSINSVFYLTNSPAGGMAELMFGYGPLGNRWTPVVGKWEDGQAGTAGLGDGIGLYDPANSLFYLRHTLESGMANMVFGFGAPGWLPLAGDWNGDGEDSIGLYDPSTGMFFQRNTNATGYAEAVFGYGSAAPGLRPLCGDWTGPASLMAAPLATLPAAAGDLDPAQIQPIIAAALSQWSALGLTAEGAARLADVGYTLTDLPGNELGRAVGTTIYLDRNAAGRGWFVDMTPDSHEEFVAQSASLLTAVDPAATPRMDLLTVVAHELGHVAGLEHVEAADALMSASLSQGTRRIAGLAERDALFALGLETL